MKTILPLLVLSVTVAIAAGCGREAAQDTADHGHEHAAGSDDHGHDHAAESDDHGHDHAAESDDHGHDHAAESDDHGHEHAAGSDDHGHEHAADDHGHDHAAGSDDHGHEHAADDHGHDHAAESDDHGHEHAADDHGHDHAAESDDHGHDHGHEGASEVVTLWGEETQLFVEFPALVRGEESPFAAHLTRLHDHFAIDAGRVVVELSSPGTPPEVFSVDRPSPAGIFRPVIHPAHLGARRVTLRLDSTAASEVHELGEFRVFASRAEADAATGSHGEMEGEISFLLEQQWKIPFRVEQIEARRLRPSVPALAVIAIPTDADAVVHAPRDGRIGAAGADFPLVGKGVRAGEVLFTLNIPPTEGSDPATVDLAVAEAEIRLRSAQREVDRLTPLVEQGVVAQRRLDEAEAELAAAEAMRRSAGRRQESLGGSQRIGAHGDVLQVPSPIRGTIAQLEVAPGTWVVAGQRLARVVEDDRLWLEVAVPEAYLGRIRDVSGVWFRLAGFDGVFELAESDLVYVASEVDPSTRTLPVRFRLENPDGEIFAGMATEAHLIVDAPVIGAAVPVDAVVDDGGTDVVYVQTGGESFTRRPVRLGIRDGEYVEVREGVTQGEWVVADGAYTVKLASTSTEAIGHGHAH